MIYVNKKGLKDPCTEEGLRISVAPPLLNLALTFWPWASLFCLFNHTKHRSKRCMLFEHIQDTCALWLIKILQMKYLRQHVHDWEMMGMHINIHECIFRLRFSYPVPEHYQPWGKRGRWRGGNKDKEYHGSEDPFDSLFVSIYFVMKMRHPICFRKHMIQSQD